MRALKVAAWSAAGLVALIAAAWLAVPALVKSQLQSRGSELLGRAVTVQRVEFSPWSLSLTLQGLAVAAAPSAGASAPPQLEVARLHVDADLNSILHLAPVIEAVQLDAPKLRVAHLAGGGWDVDDIVARLKDRPSPPDDGEPARFALYNLQLRDGEVQFDDRPVDRRHTLAALQVALPFLSNLPAYVAVNVEPRLAFALDGSAIDLRGRALPYASDRATELAIDIAEVDLARWWAYLPKDLPLRPQGGRFAAALKLQFSQPAGQVARVGLRGKTTLKQLALNNAAGAPMLGWREVAVELADVRPLERQVTLGAVLLDGVQAEVRRDARGAIEWAALGTAPGRPAVGAGPVPAVPAPAPASAASASASASSPASPAATVWRVATGPIELRQARVRWSDAAVQPAVAWSVEPFDATLARLRWPTEGEVPVKATARVMADDKPLAQLTLDGEASDRRAALKLGVEDLQLRAAAPYLKTVLRPALEGRARLLASLDWVAAGTQDAATPARSVVTAQTLQLDGLRLTEPGARSSALRVASLVVQNAQADLLARRLSVQSIAVKQPVVQLQRTADGLLNVQGWAVSAPPAAVSAPGAAAGPEWRAELGPLRIDGGAVAWRDAAVRPGMPLAMQLDGLRLALDRLTWPLSSRPARMELAAQVHLPAVPGETAELPGRLQAKGTLVLAPLAWRGSVDAQRLPVHAFEPYFGAALPVQLRRAELGVRGDIDLQLRAQGLKLDAKADVLVADVLVRARDSAQAEGDELLSWQSLSLKPVRVALAPGMRPRVEIDAVQWSDFYSRLVITEEGRFNLRDVAAAPEGAASAAAPIAVRASASAAEGAASSASGSALPLDLIVGTTQLVNGRVDFTDRFIRPNYSAALSELNGTLGKLDSRTRDMATLELRGRAAGTALLEIRGAVNPTAEPLALDISARATDLELAPLSPYAGKYAGYAIERGKLSMDIAYRIDPDGKLEAKNQVILNQLTFGEKIDSPVATKLPVRLAVALLADRNGVIDINLPVTGSINDPQFSVWGIVWKLIGNLLVKAFTAPFALLAGGATEDLSLVQFVPGTTTIAPASAPVIERVAKALVDRPSLRMTVTGAADPVSEREAVRHAALEAAVANEQRRELARSGAGAAPAASAPLQALPALSGPAREQIVKRLYADAKLPNKPRNLIGMAKDLPLAEMETLLKGATVVSTDTARELAIQRGLAVRDALIAKGLPSERLFLGAPKVHLAGEDDKAWSPRVQLSLTGP